ncbi:hypothetical protein BT93_G0250 [Corymbia citriodora subsp. variegata]|nr:hypothetical protein BT93_G0250 [Corymbia citriodora subsp. variegata]
MADIVAGIVVSVACEVGKCLLPTVGPHCGYVIFSDRHVRKLDDEVKKLESRRDEVQRSIDVARSNLTRIFVPVEEWMKEADAGITNAGEIRENDGIANTTCFYGWLPNPKARYRLGKKASRTVKDIEELIRRGQFERVSDEDPPPGLVSGAPDVNSSAGDGDGGDFITDSRAPVFQGIMKALDDEKYKVIGVYGPGGVGKTTLLKEVEKKLREEGGPFKLIVNAKVSQTPRVTKIQDGIAYGLGLKTMKDEPSEEGRRDLLLKKLKEDPNEKVLIILDDLWTKLDLEAVGIPSGDTSGKCKLLLTSRFKDVLEQKMLANRTFFVEGLNDDEAFRLFEKTVGDRLKDNENLKAIGDQLVKKLAGLPLLIISVASTLKYSDESAWRNTLIEIDESTKEIKETIVQLSYGHLKSVDAKSLFLLCGLIGGTIQVELLFVLAVGLGLFERFNKTIQNLRDRLNTALKELHSACLLLDGGNNKNNVTIHDLYSEVVISTPFRGQNSLMMNSTYDSWSEEKLKKCWAIYLADVGKDRLAELMQYEFPHLNILMLSQPGGWDGRPAHQHDEGDCCRLDFTNMKELRVLYLRSMHITTLPSLIGIIGNLQSLYLDHCDVGDVVILGKLKALQILSFTGSTISRLPKEIGHLTNLRSLNLSNCKKLKIIEFGALKGLINLEELYMKQSVDPWKSVDMIGSKSFNATLVELSNATLVELKSLTKLTSLEISIYDPTILLEGDDLPCWNLINFWIKIGNIRSWTEYEGLSTMKLNLEGCNRILSREWIKKTLQNTQYLHLDRMREFKENAHELCIGGFPQLMHLNIEDSPSIKYIASSSDGAFPNLESLSLTRLINLEKICDNSISTGNFSKLKIVKVLECGQLKYLWCLSQMQRLGQLEEISVIGCNSMRAIATGGAGEDIGSTVNVVKEFNVRRLHLERLPNMTSFCTAAGITSEGAPLQVSFPRLEELTIGGPLDLEKILYSQPPLEYINLKSISIVDSKSTSSILKSDWIPMLPNLESLNIYCCDSTKAIFELRDLKVAGHVEILSRLEKLSFVNLQNLQHIWKQDVQLQGIVAFRNLKKLVVQDTGLAFLFPVSVAKCLREIRGIFISACPNMKSMIVDEEGRDEGTDDIIEFPLLKRLVIAKCAMEKFFSCPSGKKDLTTTTSYSQDAYSDSFFDQKVSFPNIRELEIEGAQCKELWNNQIPNDSFGKLESLKLNRCDNLQHIVPSHMWKRLHHSLKEVRVTSCHSTEIIFEGGEIEYIDVEHCRNMEMVIVDEGGRDGGTDDIIEFPLLRRLHINDCPMKKFFSCPYGKKESVIITSNSQDDACADSFFNRKVSFPNIREVEIEGAQCKELWNNQIPNDSFGKLESLKLNRCDNLQHIFPSHIWKRLHHSLKEVQVTSCHSTEIIFEGGEIEYIDAEHCRNMEMVIVDEGGRDGGTDDIIEFPLLQTLHINDCPMKKFFSCPRGKKESVIITSNSQDDACADSFFNRKVSFPNIRELKIEGLRCKELWNNQIPNDSFCKLESLKLNRCDNLQRIAPSHMWKRLQCCLENLEVISCRSIEIIYESDGTDIEGGKLTKLVLRDLENLGHIWQCDDLPNVPFPNLRDVEVVRCSHLEMLFPTFTAKFLGQIEELMVESCEDMKQIAGHEKPEEVVGTTITFSNLIALRLFELPKFRSFLPEGYSLKFPCSEDFPSLREVSIVSCGVEPVQVLGDWERCHQQLRQSRELYRSLWDPHALYITFGIIWNSFDVHSLFILLLRRPPSTKSRRHTSIAGHHMTYPPPHLHRWPPHDVPAATPPSTNSARTSVMTAGFRSSTLVLLSPYSYSLSIAFANHSSFN